MDKAAGGTGKANYLFLGNLNTMGGYAYPYMTSSKRVTEFDEIDRLKRTANGRSMQLLSEDETGTFSNDPADFVSDLDHVIASDHLQFKQFNGADVTVLGWPKEPTLAQQQQ